MWTENVLKTNDDMTVIKFARVLLKHKCKMTVDCCVFKFLRRSVDGKHLMRFQSEPPSKFFGSSVNVCLKFNYKPYVEKLKNKSYFVLRIEEQVSK